MEVGCSSDTGRKRKVNEDKCFLDANRGLFIVADGAGGHRAGETASEIAIETVSRSLFPAGGVSDYERMEGSISDATRRSIEEATTFVKFFELIFSFLILYRSRCLWGRGAGTSSLLKAELTDVSTLLGSRETDLLSTFLGLALSTRTRNAASPS